MSRTINRTYVIIIIVIMMIIIIISFAVIGVNPSPLVCTSLEKNLAGIQLSPPLSVHHINISLLPLLDFLIPFHSGESVPAAVSLSCTTKKTTKNNKTITVRASHSRDDSACRRKAFFLSPLSSHSTASNSFLSLFGGDKKKDIPCVCRA